MSDNICWIFIIMIKTTHFNVIILSCILTAEAKAEAKAMASRSRPRPKLRDRGRGQNFGLEASLASRT